MSTLSVNNIVEKTTNAGVHIPGHMIQVINSNNNGEFERED